MHVKIKEPTMNNHDPMCPVDLPRMGPPATCFWCEVIARVRADEQDTKFAQLDHDEAVPLRKDDPLNHDMLAVEVRLRELVKTNFDMFHEAQLEKRKAVADRDAARAEVADLRETVRLLRGQMDALLSDEAKWGYNIRREALAGLRAKVEGLGLCIECDDGDECLCGPVEFNSARVTLDKVLALLDEEAKRG